jgi:uncharacterized membrane protein YedE/YeeE
MNGVIALLAGVLFGFGLDLARMTDPERVIGFLDVAGTWDPTLVFVLAGAVVTATIGFRLVGGRTSWFGGALRLPQRRDIDRPLVAGAALFGAGWGMAGYCPGPGLAALVQGAADPLWFVVGLVLGMILFARTLGRAS